MHLVIFDVDGTLTRSNQIDTECFARAFADEFDLTINTNWLDYSSPTDSGVARQILQHGFGRPPSDEDEHRVQQRFIGLLERALIDDPACCPQVAGAAAALRQLRQHPDWAVAIATGCWQASALLKLKTAEVDAGGLPAAFAEDGLSRELVVRTAVLRAQTQHGEFDRVISVGDALWDVRTAQRLGVAFVGVGGARSAATLQQAGATHVVPDFGDFGRLVQTLHEAEIPTL